MAATVTTRGEAVVAGSPDEGIWTIELAALAETPDAALADVGERSRALAALLDELDVPAEKRSTTGVTVREQFDHVDGKQVHRGFRAQDVVTIRLADPAVAGRLIQGAIETAKASVHGPLWWIAPDNPARIEACRRAAAEAKRKAEAYAESLGLRLGPVTEIREPDTSERPTPRPAFGKVLSLASSAEPLDVDPGELNVAAAVEVSFMLER